MSDLENHLDTSLKDMGLLEDGMSLEDKKNLLKVIELSKESANVEALRRENHTEKDRHNIGINNVAIINSEGTAHSPSDILQIELLDSDDSGLVTEKLISCQGKEKSSENNNPSFEEITCEDSNEIPSTSFKRKYFNAFSPNKENYKCFPRKYKISKFNRFPFYLNNKNVSLNTYSTLFIKHVEKIISLAIRKNSSKISNFEWVGPIIPASETDLSQLLNEDIFKFRIPREDLSEETQTQSEELDWDNVVEEKQIEHVIIDEDNSEPQDDPLKQEDSWEDVIDNESEFTKKRMPLNQNEIKQTKKRAHSHGSPKKDDILNNEIDLKKFIFTTELDKIKLLNNDNDDDDSIQGNELSTIINTPGNKKYKHKISEEYSISQQVEMLNCKKPRKEIGGKNSLNSFTIDQLNMFSKKQEDENKTSSETMTLNNMSSKKTKQRLINSDAPVKDKSNTNLRTCENCQKKFTLIELAKHIPGCKRNAVKRKFDFAGPSSSFGETSLTIDHNNYSTFTPISQQADNLIDYHNQFDFCELNKRPKKLGKKVKRTGKKVKRTTKKVKRKTKTKQKKIIHIK